MKLELTEIDQFQQHAASRGRCMKRYFASSAAGLLLVLSATAQQVVDTAFDASVADPAHAGRNVRVLIDAAHFNSHTSESGYKPLADLLRNDGCVVEACSVKFSAETLRECNILIIANALGANGMGRRGADASAFTEDECDVVETWVKAGGSLLLVADHFPAGVAAASLAKRFGIVGSGGKTSDLILKRDAGLIGDHPITNGRHKGERIETVGAFSGQTLTGPPDAKVLFMLPKNAIERLPHPEFPWDSPPEAVDAGSKAQGLALQFGNGRVVVLGEAAMLTAQVSGPGKEKSGMNTPGVDNKQFALNVVRWLSGVLANTDSNE